MALCNMLSSDAESARHSPSPADVHNMCSSNAKFLHVCSKCFLFLYRSYQKQAGNVRIYNRGCLFSKVHSYSPHQKQPVAVFSFFICASRRTIICSTNNTGDGLKSHYIMINFIQIWLEFLQHTKSIYLYGTKSHAQSKHCPVVYHKTMWKVRYYMNGQILIFILDSGGAASHD